jgi:hypothetical protein
VRTTLTLDPDVARMLEAEAHRTRSTFKQVVNDAIRRGLSPTATKRDLPPYRVKPHKTTLNPEFVAVSFNRIADQLEDEAIIERMVADLGHS